MMVLKSNMKKIKFLLPVLAFGLFNFVACANGGNEEGRHDTATTTPSGPAPDNSAATNPSLADTLQDNQDTSANK
jgi:hypothetical protein